MRAKRAPPPPTPYAAVGNAGAYVRTLLMRKSCVRVDALFISDAEHGLYGLVHFLFERDHAL